MSYEDYNQGEIDNMVHNLLNYWGSKLKDVEVKWLQERKFTKFTQQDRDTLIAMYDRMAESSY